MEETSKLFLQQKWIYCTTVAWEKLVYTWDLINSFLQLSENKAENTEHSKRNKLAKIWQWGCGQENHRVKWIHNVHPQTHKWCNTFTRALHSKLASLFTLIDITQRKPSQTQGENENATQKGIRPACVFEPRPFLMWGDSAVLYTPKITSWKCLIMHT